MAVYRDIDSDVRIGGSLMLPAGSLTIQGVNILDELHNRVLNSIVVSAGTGLIGGGSLSEDRTLSVSFAGTGSAATVSRSDHDHDSSYLSLNGGTLNGGLDINGTIKHTGLSTGNTQLINIDSSTKDKIFIGNTSTALTLEGSSLKYNTVYDIYHAGNFNPANKADVTALASHTENSSIHKNWGNWSTNSSNDLRVNDKRAVVHVTSTDKLFLNYGGDFTGGVDINGTLTNSGNQVWHTGNLSKADFLTTTSVATVVSNFTVAGRQWVGNTGNTGSIVLRDTNAQNTIYIDGGNGGTVSNWRIYLNGATGAAKFNGTVQVANLVMDSTSMVKNLNAEFIGGSKETEFVRTPSIRDQQGWGVHSGLEVKQKSPTPDMTVQVNPGIAYTNSGRRFEWTTATVVPISQASVNYDRIDIIFIYGKEDGANEGTFGIVKGAADRVSPIPPTSDIPVGAFPIAHVYIKANIGTITDGTANSFNAIDNSIRKLKSVRLSEGQSLTILESTYVGGDIYEKGMKLEDKYPQLKKPNLFQGNQFVDGRVSITSSGTLGGGSNDNYYLRIKDNSVSLSIDPNEIVTSSDMNLNSGSFILLRAGTGGTERIEMNGRIKATRNAKTLTIPAGSTSVKWSHGHGSDSYAVNMTPNSFARHVRWANKTANDITIEIDESFEQDILVDCILIGY